MMNAMFSKFFKTAETSLSKQLLVAPDTCIYAIGDIHGRHDLLLKILDIIQNDASSVSDDRNIRLVFLGDYIDRGDDTQKVLETLRQLDTENPGIVCLEGNHEMAMKQFIGDPINENSWLRYGAQQTLASYGLEFDLRKPGEQDRTEIRNALHRALGPHLDFVNSLEFFVRSADVIFTHAGIDPSNGLADPNRDNAVWGHPDFISDLPVEGLLCVHGHHDAPDPVIQQGRICVDTGAYYSGKLTAVRIDENIKILST